MLYINNLSTDPYYNLALEEFLLKNYKEDIFMLWQNEECVVVGKHQNTLAEVNQDYLEANKIKIARRLSGGGTVYHDLGNLNFTYIINSSEGKLVDFERYTKDIVEALNLLGVPAQSNSRHDIIIEGKKISGNAEHIHKNRVLHHGTLLFNSNLEKLDQAIRPFAEKYFDKAVRSVRSKVCNIKEYLNNHVEINQFKDFLMDFMLKRYSPIQIQELVQDQTIEIQKLRDNKYVTWEWIYAYSPKFEIKSQMKLASKTLSIRLLISKGIVQECSISGYLIQKDFFQKITKELVGIKHHRETILNHLNEKVNVPSINNFTFDKFVNHLF